MVRRRRRLLLLLCAALAGCHTDAVPADSIVVRDGGYGELPTRTVVSEFPDAAGFEVPGTGGAISGGGGGGGEGGAGGAPAEPTPDAASEAGAAPGTCAVLLQDCAAGKGCYPAGGGVGACQVAGELGPRTPCGEHTQCAPGLICVDPFGAGGRLCEPICDTTRAGSCNKGEICRPYAGKLGFCTE